MKLITVSLILAAALPALAVPPVDSNVRASQRPGTELVEVYYDVSDADGGSLTVEMQVLADSGLTDSIPCPPTGGDIAAGVPLRANKDITWIAGTDWGGNFVGQTKVRVEGVDETTSAAPFGCAGDLQHHACAESVPARGTKCGISLPMSPSPPKINRYPAQNIPTL